MDLRYFQFQLPYYGVEGVQFQFHKNRKIKKCMLWEPGMALEKDVLYAARYDRLLEAEGGEESVFCVYGCPAEHRFLVRDGFYVRENCPASKILNVLYEIASSYQRWEFALLYSERMDLPTLLELSEPILRMPLCIADNRYKYLAMGPVYEAMFPSEEVRQDEIDEIVWTEEFRQCGKKRGVFYFALESAGKDLLCYNIAMNHKYYARLLGSVENVPYAAMQESLFGRLASAVDSIFAIWQIQRPYPVKDQEFVHSVQMLLDGQQPDDAQSLERNHWRREHRYQVIVFSFDGQYPAEEGIRFLHTQVNSIFAESCVVIRNNDLVCVRNFDNEKEQQDFRGRLAVFLRENVAKAGISNVFRGYRDMKMYLGQAYDALRLGQKKNPHFWHYSFEDYALEAALEQCVEKYPADQLLHPGLLKLMEQDKEKGSELLRTLQIYLETGCNATQTAEKLYIHRSSFLKRLERIRQVSGVNLSDNDTRFYLLLSFRLIDRDQSTDCMK